MRPRAVMALAAVAAAMASGGGTMPPSAESMRKAPKPVVPARIHEARIARAEAKRARKRHRRAVSR